MNTYHSSITRDIYSNSSPAAITLQSRHELLAKDDVDQSQPKDSRLTLPILTAVWLGVIVIGMNWLQKYEATPGKTVKSPTDWPANSLIGRSTSRATLVLFVHPRCPCSRATINELALIMAHCPGHVDAKVLFFKPSSFSADWEKTDLWFSAAAIPGVKVVCDEAGREAARSRATTSGYSLLYNQRGQLWFRGGITGSRGHSGDNAGRNAIESLLLGKATSQKQTFVFGCPLLGRDAGFGMEYQE